MPLDPPPLNLPIGVHADVGVVVWQFAQPEDRLVFTPEQARLLARYLEQIEPKVLAKAFADAARRSCTLRLHNRRE